MAQNNQTDHLRILLLGKTGSGKSSAGNTILGRRAFGVAFSAASATSKSNSHDVTLGGQKITVIDTPGLYDTSMKIAQLKHEIEKLFNHSGDGIHAILLVIKLGAKFTEEERNTVQWIKENFGEDVSKNTIVLFTNGDELEHSGMTIKDYINEGGKLRGLVEQCNGRYQVFNNRAEDQTQVTELLRKIREMIQENNNNIYTKEKYQEFQRKLKIAKFAGVVTAGVIGAGAAGGTAAVAGAATATVVAATLTGGVSLAVAAGATGAGVVIYKCAKRSTKDNN